MGQVEISRNIHFIWFGGVLPHTYLDNLFAWQVLAQKSGYKVYLWTDLPELSLPEYFPDGLLRKPRAGINSFLRTLARRGIRVYHYSDLFKHYQHKPNNFTRFNSSRHLCDLSKLDCNSLSKTLKLLGRGVDGNFSIHDAIHIELSDNKPNYAVASDIFRMAALYFMGGIYIDVGDVACLQDSQPLPNPFIIRFDDTKPFNLAMRMFVYESNSNCCNDILIAAKQSAGILQFLENVIAVYKRGSSWCQFEDYCAAKQSGKYNLESLQQIQAAKKHFVKNVYPETIAKNPKISRQDLWNLYKNYVQTKIDDNDALQNASNAHLNFIVGEFCSGPGAVYNALIHNWFDYLVFKDDWSQLLNTHHNSTYLLKNQIDQSSFHQESTWQFANFIPLKLSSEESALETLRQSNFAQAAKHWYAKRI